MVVSYVAGTPTPLFALLRYAATAAYLQRRRQHYFNLKAGNGETILSSEGYTSMRSCKKGIASVMKNASDASKYVTQKTKNGKPYFTHKAGNHQVIGKSELYESD